MALYGLRMRMSCSQATSMTAPAPLSWSAIQTGPKTLFFMGFFFLPLFLYSSSNCCARIFCFFISSSSSYSMAPPSSSSSSPAKISSYRTEQIGCYELA